MKRVYFIRKQIHYIDSGDLADNGQFGFMPNAYSSIEAAQKALEGLVKTHRKYKYLYGDNRMVYGERKWPELNLVECFKIVDLPLLDEDDLKALDELHK